MSWGQMSYIRLLLPPPPPPPPLLLLLLLLQESHLFPSERRFPARREA